MRRYQNDALLRGCYRQRCDIGKRMFLQHQGRVPRRRLWGFVLFWFHFSYGLVACMLMASYALHQQRLCSPAFSRGSGPIVTSKIFGQFDCRQPLTPLVCVGAIAKRLVDSSCGRIKMQHLPSLKHLSWIWHRTECSIVTYPNLRIIEVV